MYKFGLGDKVKCIMCGVHNNKTGIIINGRSIPTNTRGVCLIDGHYKPVNWNDEIAIKADDGEIFTAYKWYVIKQN